MIFFLGSISVTSPSYTSTFLLRCLVKNLVGSNIDRADSVPTVTEGRRGLKRK
jgi:predicted solute-binding protein